MKEAVRHTLDVGGKQRLWYRRSNLKRLAKTHLAGDRDLIRRDAAFEEVREFLDVLQIHERERILCAVDFLQAEHCESLVGDELTPIVELKYQVEPGKSQAFHYTIEGPYYLGSYTLEWAMVVNNKPFGNEEKKIIEVVAPK